MAVSIRFLCHLPNEFEGDTFLFKNCLPDSRTDITSSQYTDRDLAHAGQRYMQMSKAALVDRLLAVEQAYAERKERWLVEQDELLQWRLRAEQAEARLQREKVVRRRHTGSRL